MGCFSKGFVISSKQCLVYQRNGLVHEIVALIVSTLDRRKSKSLLTIDEHGSKIARNSVCDCHLSPFGRQIARMATNGNQNIVSNDFFLYVR